ncbi:MAG TPA: tRNA lysidine(34) synthetase TilS [Steroidobacteraceae bacterium]|nr:tRNA lysidine(34) synthetase TilS [Steroidobacteraceae bacterium]
MGRATAFEQRLAASLAALLPEYPKVLLCVAFSGGLDSTALLAALVTTPGLRHRLRAVHVDHGLHPSSPGWARHCRAVAQALGVPLTVLEEKVHRPRGASLEAAAREARYRALARELAPSEVLLTAQHADDQLETVLLQLLRGAGLPGLAAMPSVAPFGRGRLARPLLALERSEIETWAREHALAWIEDDTNADERLDRNYLRRRILPLVRARWPAAARAGARTARHAAEAQRLLELIGRADVERAAVGTALSIPRLRALTLERRRNALRYWIARAGYVLPDTRRLDELAGPVLDARRDAQPEVAWGRTVARRESGLLSLATTAGRASLDPLPWLLRGDSVLTLPAGLGRLELRADPHGPLDIDLLPESLTVCLRRGGERLRPRRGGRTRTLKALFSEARIAHAERGRIPLLWAGEQLVAVGDLWADARVQAAAATRRRGRLVWHRDG